MCIRDRSLAKPSNFLARIGTPMKQLIEACGGLPEDTGKIIGCLLYTSLCPDAETEGNHEDDHVEDTGDGRCSQLDFAHTPEEGGVRHTYHLLHKEAD